MWYIMTTMIMMLLLLVWYGRYGRCGWCRMNVDNGIKIFKYNGVLALDTRVPTLYDAMYRPLPAALFPDRGAHSVYIWAAGPACETVRLSLCLLFVCM